MSACGTIPNYVNCLWSAWRHIMDVVKRFRILSIDGGGVRGIIAARLLQDLEERSQQPISRLFDLIVGTSTGGLIALGLTCSRDFSQKPLYCAKDLVDFYYRESGRIFKRSFWRRLRTGGGLWDAKYDREPYDSILKNLFGEHLFTKALCPVVIPTYSLLEQAPHLFSVQDALKNKVDYWVRDLAGATSAAPTYFDPKRFEDHQGHQYVEIDGGVFANNPESIGVMEACKIAPTLERMNICLVSIGTGRVNLNRRVLQLSDTGVMGWMVQANLIDLMMSADSSWYYDEISALYPDSYRLQVVLPNECSAMDNANQSNLDQLLGISESFLSAREKDFSQMLKRLQSDRGSLA